MPSKLRDPRADRRFEHGRAAAADAAWTEAIDLYEQALELAPDWIGAWTALGDARLAGGDRVSAGLAFGRARDLDPTDRHGATLRLAALDPTQVPSSAPSDYIGALFDAYAPRFEAHLTESLGYRGPDDLVEALAETGLTRFGDAIDLGCGTGLGGVALRPLVQTLTGVDLSHNMVAAARTKALYDRLAVGEIVAFLDGEPADSADLILAADVFVYVGDLAPVFAETARVLRPGGAIAFTAQLWVEASSPLGFRVGDDLRFAHAETYLVRALATAGFTVAIATERRARLEKTRNVPGLVMIATLDHDADKPCPRPRSRDADTAHAGVGRPRLLS